MRMRAIRVEAFGDPGVLRLVDGDDLRPAAGQVLVDVHAAGVNPVETYIRSGAYARKPPLPYTPGTDGAGVVRSLGEGVTGLRPGDRVWIGATGGACSGTYAQQVVCDAALVHPLPDGVGFEQGAAIGVPAATAWRALNEAHAAAGDTILIHGGSGGVGLAAIQLAAASGLTVFATAGSPEGLRLIAEQGARHVFDHTREGYRDEIVAATGGRGPDIIVEMLANVNLSHDLSLVAPRGRVVIVGSRGTAEVLPRDIMSKESHVTGIMLFNTTPEEMRRVTAAVTDALRSGVLHPVVGERFPLAEAARAHERVMSPGARGKIVLLPR
jgi:NADPH:quinone reductase